MSRATDLAKLPRHRVVEIWLATFSGASPEIARPAVRQATKEQLIAAIVTEEERCQSPPPR